MGRIAAHEILVVRLRREEAIAGLHRGGDRLVEAAGGLLTGRFKAWHDNGAKAAILDYDQGRRQGEYSAWTRDGVRIAVGQCVDDKPVGCWETYYENGEPSSKGAYQDGTKTGKWFYWDAQGNRRKEVTGPDAEDGCMWMW